MKVVTLAAGAIAATLLAAAPARGAETMYLLDGGDIVVAPADRPEEEFATLPLTGLSPDHALLSIDVRPKDGKLYGLVVHHTPTPDDLYLYVLDVSGSGAVAAPVGGPLDIDPQSATYELDFSAATDRARVVSSEGQSFRVNPQTGVVVDGDPLTAGPQPDATLTYALGDPSGPGTADVRGLAYTDNRDGATGATLLGLERGEPVRLVRIGGPNGIPSANAGVVTTLASLSFPGDTVGLDVSEESGLAYATSAWLDLTTIHRIDPSAFTSSTMGVTEGFARDIALAPAATIGLAGDATASEKDGKAVVEVTRTGGASGAMSVGWVAGSGSAAAGEDFPAASGTVEFADGETSKTIEVPLTNDSATEGRESLLVELGEPMGNRTMGAIAGRNRATVVIEDDEAPPAATPAPVPTPTPVPTVVPDTKAPAVTLRGVPRTIKRAAFLRGFNVTVTPSEPVELSVALHGTPGRRATIAAYELELFTTRLRPAAGARTVRVRPKRKLVGRLRRSARVRLRIEALDAAGNRTTTVRTVRVTR